MKKVKGCNNADGRKYDKRLYLRETLRATPEEVQAIQPFIKKLIVDYGYPKSNIAAHPQWRVKVRPSDVKQEYPVDIAVFSNNKHSDDNCYINSGV